MKKTHMTLLTAAMLSLSSFAVADYAPSCETDTCIAPVTANAHRVYFGPEFMWSHFHGDLLKQDVYYGGLRFGYEFLRALGEGPPWPTLDAMSKRLDDL